MNNTTSELKMKVCNKCGEKRLLNVDNFNLNNKMKDGFYNTCKVCMTIYNKKYRELNREKLIRKDKKYKETHKDKIKQYRENNHEKIIENKRRYREENKLKIRDYNRQYRKEKSELRRIQKQRRRTLENDSFSFYTNELWTECKTHFDNKCAYCGKKSELTQDHFIPVSKGGDYSKSNIIPCCSKCNSSKRDCDFFEWYRYKKFYSSEREMKILNYLNYKENIQQMSFI